ncbi:MAG: ATP synthase subunit I [Clostridiaceae bacterium]
MDKLFSKIIIMNNTLTLLGAGICYLLTKDISVVLGLLIGGVARTTGFIGTILTSKKLIYSRKPYIATMLSYLIRFAFYGVVIVFALKNKINIITLLIGFTLLNPVIYFYRKEED